jgi:phosphatidylserine synthase
MMFRFRRSVRRAVRAHLNVVDVVMFGVLPGAVVLTIGWLAGFALWAVVLIYTIGLMVGIASV